MYNNKYEKINSLLCFCCKLQKKWMYYGFGRLLNYHSFCISNDRQSSFLYEKDLPTTKYIAESS